ncbi:MAG: adenylyl-sulfate kinase [Lachnospiraceae bacterium]|nr:adenylyl-sulfate kinase [Lachnospiraceae bacterium]
MEKGFLLYMIGRSGSGKSTIAEALEHEFKKNETFKVQVIDGDVIRKELGDLFGYTFEERMKNNQVVRVIVQYLINNGINVVLSQVGAYQAMRDKMREQFGKQYIEIYVKCATEECKRRDVKGYYKAKMENLNGITDPFEEPLNSDLVIDTESLNVSSAVEEIIIYLNEKKNIKV